MDLECINNHQFLTAGAGPIIGLYTLLAVIAVNGIMYFFCVVRGNKKPEYKNEKNGKPLEKTDVEMTDVEGKIDAPNTAINADDDNYMA